MSSVFITYRRDDSASGVLALYDYLCERFGSGAVTLDTNSFEPGMPWLPQIRAAVASCDLLLCVIGPNWEAERSTQPGQVDYVAEELLLAKALGKPIVPVNLGVNLGTAWSKLPNSLSWLPSLHVISFHPGRSAQEQTLAESISAAAGLRLRERASAASSHSLLRLPGFAAIARSIVSSQVQPLSSTAAALRPSAASLFSSAILVVLSLIALALTSALIWSDTSSYLVARQAASIMMLMAMSFALIWGLSKVLGVAIATRAAGSAALHVSGSLHLAIAGWTLVFWLVIPDNLQHQLLGLMTSDVSFGLTLERVNDSISTPRAFVLSAVQLLAISHLGYMIFGASRALAAQFRAGAVLVVAPVLGTLCAFGLLAITLFTASTESQGDGLPKSVVLSWKNDVREVTGVKRSPFRIEMHAVVEKIDQRILLRVSKLMIENRGQPISSFPEVSCALLTLSKEGWKHTDPPHQGRTSIKAEVPPGSTVVVNPFGVELPLSDELRSGQTSLICGVSAPNGISYPLHDGTPGILSW